jgi:hypothetical protein
MVEYLLKFNYFNYSFYNYKIDLNDYNNLISNSLEYINNQKLNINNL